MIGSNSNRSSGYTVDFRFRIFPKPQPNIGVGLVGVIYHQPHPVSRAGVWAEHPCRANKCAGLAVGFAQYGLPHLHGPLLERPRSLVPIFPLSLAGTRNQQSGQTILVKNLVGLVSIGRSALGVLDSFDPQSLPNYFIYASLAR